MTYKEAIKVIRRILKAFDLSKFPEDHEECEALEMALQALKQCEKMEGKIE